MNAIWYIKKYHKNLACTNMQMQHVLLVYNLTPYDDECRELRSQAVAAGAHISCPEERAALLEKCKRYRACKQRKQRTYRRTCIDNIENAYSNHKSNMWSA